MSSLTAAYRDIFDVLVHEHRDLQALLWDLEWVTSRGEQAIAEELFDELSAALLGHLEVEEKLLYQRVEGTGAVSGAMLTRARAAHAAIAQRVKELGAIGYSSLPWRDTLRDLRDLLDRHVRQDERELFPSAAGVLGAGESLELGTRVHLIRPTDVPRANAA